MLARRPPRWTTPHTFQRGREAEVYGIGGRPREDREDVVGNTKPQEAANTCDKVEHCRGFLLEVAEKDPPKAQTRGAVGVGRHSPRYEDEERPARLDEAKADDGGHLQEHPRLTKNPSTSSPSRRRRASQDDDLRAHSGKP